MVVDKSVMERNPCAYVEDRELTSLNDLDPSSQGNFDLDIYKRGTKFTNSGVYQAVKQCHLAQLHSCIEYGKRHTSATETLKLTTSDRDFRLFP